MAKANRTTNGKKKNGIVNLKIVAEKIQKSLSLGKNLASRADNEEEEFEEGTDDSSCTNVPDDVKEGHFAVIAMDDEELKRFIVPLTFLKHPTFLRLLQRAAEEYGFDREGALTVPCRPSELERILAEQWVEEGWKNSSRAKYADSWSRTKTMVRSC